MNLYSVHGGLLSLQHSHAPEVRGNGLACTEHTQCREIEADAWQQQGAITALDFACDSTLMAVGAASVKSFGIMLLSLHHGASMFSSIASIPVLEAVTAVRAHDAKQTHQLSY